MSTLNQKDLPMYMYTLILLQHHQSLSSSMWDFRPSRTCTKNEKLLNLWVIIRQGFLWSIVYPRRQIIYNYRNPKRFSTPYGQLNRKLWLFSSFYRDCSEFYALLATSFTALHYWNCHKVILSYGEVNNLRLTQRDRGLIWSFYDALASS